MQRNRQMTRGSNYLTALAILIYESRSPQDAVLVSASNWSSTASWSSPIFFSSCISWATGSHNSISKAFTLYALVAIGLDHRPGGRPGMGHHLFCSACCAVALNDTFLAMHFPISGTDISPVYLVVIGFLIGVLGGFFGVGGSFIAGPALRAVGMHWNFAVGTDLAHIVGKSVVAAKRHRALGQRRSAARLDHGPRHDRWRGSRRAVDPDVEARGQRRFRGQHRFDRDLFQHLHLHDLGKLRRPSGCRRQRAPGKNRPANDDER